MQYALADFLRDCPEHHRELGAFYQPKRDLFCELLATHAFDFMPAAGTYFQLADYSDISDLSDTEFARLLDQRAWCCGHPGIGVLSSARRSHAVVRFCFAKDDETLRAAGQRLCAV